MSVSARRAVRLALPLLLLLLAPSLGCSVKQLALNSVADALSSGTGGSFSRDDDLQIVGDALPFSLKLMESINDSVPKHVGIKQALASGFVQYGVVYVEWPAEQLKWDDFEAYNEGLFRARKFYRRAAGYALDGLDLKYPDFRSRIMTDTDAALSETDPEDTPLLFWLGAAWLAAVTTDLQDPEMFGLFPTAAALIHRAQTLDPDWDGGAIHEVLISLEPALPLPGGAERSKRHYEAALELQGRTKAGPHVSYATAVPLKAQDKEAFVRLLEEALAVDLEAAPDSRLANEYAQARARFLLDHLDDLFLE